MADQEDGQVNGIAPHDEPVPTYLVKAVKKMRKSLRKSLPADLSLPELEDPSGHALPDYLKASVLRSSTRSFYHKHPTFVQATAEEGSKQFAQFMEDVFTHALQHGLSNHGAKKITGEAREQYEILREAKARGQDLSIMELTIKFNEKSLEHLRRKELKKLRKSTGEAQQDFH